MHDQFSKAWQYIDVEKEVNIDKFPGLTFALWASTPAVIWTAERPQERGIHVHLHMDGKRVIDDTFGTVIYKGKKLNRADLMEAMVSTTVI